MMVLNQSCLRALYPPPPPPPPPLPRDANPLAGLLALPKPHYSWYRCTAGQTCGWSGWSRGLVGSDNNATLIDYARITHSMPVTHGGSEEEVAEAVAICVAAGRDSDGP
jgi:hypothetical protein